MQPLLYMGSVCQVPTEAEGAAVRSGSRFHPRRTMSIEFLKSLSEPCHVTHLRSRINLAVIYVILSI